MADAGRSKSIVWSPVCHAAFSESKKSLAAATLLHHPSLSRPMALTVDASDVTLGAKLLQMTGGSWMPVAFYSKKLSPAQKKYSALDRELLAMYQATKHF